MSSEFVTQTGTDIALAAHYLQQGNCVAIPTETVYGLAANALDESAVRKIYQIKERPATNPLIVHLPGAEEIGRVASEVPELALRLLERFAPGPLTVLLPRRPELSPVVTAGLPHVAVRIPAHPMTRELLYACGLPLAAPSANLYTRISPTTAAHVAAQLNGRIPYILDGGPCNQGIESTIVGFDQGKAVLYRLGSISLEALREVIPDVVVRNSSEQQVMAPGMAKLHYAPRVPLTLTHDVVGAASALQEPYAVINFAAVKTELPTPYQLVLSKSGDPAEAARNLYAALHEADALPVTRIIAELAPETGAGRAINDRLKRAAH